MGTVPTWSYITVRRSRRRNHCRPNSIRLRPGSAALARANLLDIAQLPHLIDEAVAHFGTLDALVNNASSFFPTPLGEITENMWDDLMGSNLKAPLFLSQAAAAAS